MTSSNSIEPPTILLVDDNPTNLQVLYAALDGRGYTLLVARSGEQAIKIAQNARPALILLDVMMPGLDGYETCVRLNEDETARECAVIFLSALHDPRDKVRGLELGAVDFITKPFDTDEVIARVERQLEVQGKQHALVEQNRRLASQLEATQRFAFDASQNRTVWVESLIEGGESERVEFKSTLRWNLKTDKADKVLETAWLKTIVAFLNTDGGVLIIGVDDAGTVLGTAADHFENDDKYLLFVNSRIKQNVGLDCAPFIRFGLIPVDDKRVLVIECRPSPTSVFLRYGDKEDFYVRVGPGSRKLTVSEVLNYVANRHA
jgi:DNA-binding response OmpR family regulator